jgi:hypothetical protein
MSGAGTGRPTIILRSTTPSRDPSPATCFDPTRQTPQSDCQKGPPSPSRSTRPYPCHFLSLPLPIPATSYPCHFRSLPQVGTVTQRRRRQSRIRSCVTRVAVVVANVAVWRKQRQRRTPSTVHLGDHACAPLRIWDRSPYQATRSCSRLSRGRAQSGRTGGSGDGSAAAWHAYRPALGGEDPPEGPEGDFGHSLALVARCKLVTHRTGFLPDQDRYVRDVTLKLQAWALLIALRSFAHLMVYHLLWVNH